MNTETVAQLVMSGLAMLGGTLAFLSKRDEVGLAKRDDAIERRHQAEQALVTEQIDNLGRRIDEHYATILRRMDAADERSSRWASMSQQVPILELRVKSLEDRLR